MIKKTVFLLVVAALAMACKKEVEEDKTTFITNHPEKIIHDKKPTAPVDGKYPVMTFEEKEHDFGEIKEGDKVDYTFKFKNTGEADLLISDAKGSCGCTIPEFPKEPIAPGQTGKMKVSFNSARKHGQVHKTVNITANTASGHEQLDITASILEKK